LTYFPIRCEAGVKLRLVAPLSVLCLLELSPLSAAGQDDRDGAAGRLLFAEGRKLAAEGNFEAACPKFEESQRLLPGIGTLFNLADCWEHLGRTASAWSRFLDVAALAQRSHEYDRERVARERAAALEPKLARLTINVAQPVEGLELRRSELVVGRALWGTPMPVDPGSYTIAASAPSKLGVSIEVQIDPGEQEIVNVPALEAATPEPPRPAPAPVQAQPVVKDTPPPPPPPPPEETPKQTTTSPWVYVLGGAGLAGIAVGTTFGLMAMSKNDEALETCTGGAQGNECRDASEAQSHADLVESAERARTISYVSFAIGGAALIGGGVLFVLEASPSRATGRIDAISDVSITALGRF
jgi:serine/threonine-protein kinase